MAIIANTNMPTKTPIASWLGLSFRIVCTIRGENWPMANCTTTLTPELAETFARNDFAGFRRNFAFGLRLMTLVILPGRRRLAVLARPRRGAAPPAAAAPEGRPR